ncbi:hypothetical protein Tco_0996245 [Tanacetum coccineum]
MFQQHHDESLSEAWTLFKDLLQNVPHHGIDLWLKVQIFYDHVNPATRQSIDQSAGVNKIASSCEICSGLHDTQYCMKNPEQAFVDYASSCTDEAGDITDESANETDDVDESDMVLSDDNPAGDDDVAGYGVFMHNNSTATPNATYLSPTVTSSSLEFIQTLLDETPANELTDFMSYLVYTDAQTTSVVHNPEGNLELTSYMVYLKYAVKTLEQLKCPILPHIPNQAHSKPKQRSQCKRQKRIRGRSTSKSSAHKFREYDQKMEALTNFNGFEAFEKVFQANVLTETKKLLHTHIPKAVANYVRPHLNTSVLYKDKIRIADLEGAGLETLKQQYKIDVELECHVDQLKATVLTEAK